MRDELSRNSEAQQSTTWNKVSLPTSIRQYSDQLGQECSHGGEQYTDTQ